MGMLMHHTWLAMRKPKAVKKTQPVAEAEKPEEPEAPVKKTGGRRKTTK